MKKEITTRSDIHFIITAFYKKLISDKEMFPFFKDIVAKNQLEHHIGIISDFWSDILLYTNTYSTNVLQKHLDFDKKIPFKKEHFDKWLQYLVSTIDTFFIGQNAQNMKDRARSIAMVMQVKMKLYS
ncbi:MAG: group III truncated hemoglobin [Flavobacteriaceae bacterium]|nr:group III truncated hemoglobin [Flavobacteriaceae bacterium]